MQTTTQRLIDAAKSATGAPSDYRIAKLMNWTPQAVSKYRTGRSQLDNRALLQIAALLKMDAADVVLHMAEIERERAHTDEQRAQWSEILRAWGGRAATVVIFCAALPGFFTPGYAATHETRTNDAPCILEVTVFRTERTRTARLFERLSRYFMTFFQNLERCSIAAPA